ncbi:hypothetical protein M3Y99_01924300 [Aphelenchoides fujianensis]|nr:hypothetical protein M3Y99_01924300 [Aphelenchoides fujianensis]
MSGEVAFPTLNYVFNRGSTDENAQNGRLFKELCGDVLEQAQLLADSVPEVRSDVTAALEEHWQNYQKRLETFDPAFDYTAGLTPVKCALAGWLFAEDAKIRCDDCRAHLPLRPVDADCAVNVEQFGRSLLASLHTAHDKLCPWRVGRTFELPAYSAAKNLDEIRSLVPDGQAECAEIKVEFTNYAAVCPASPDFALCFAVAGWRACNNRLHCDYCLKFLNVPDLSQRAANPLKLHHSYCPVLEVYPLWKLAIEEYVQQNSDPTALNENFALIQQQLASADLLSETIPEEPPAVEVTVESTTADVNQSAESVEPMEEVEETPAAPQPLRDVDFEEAAGERSRKRVREREEAAQTAMEGVESAPKRQRPTFPLPAYSTGNTWDIPAERVAHAAAVDPLALGVHRTEEAPIDSPAAAFHAEDTPRSPVEQEVQQHESPPVQMHEEEPAEEEGDVHEEQPEEEEAEDEGIDESAEYQEEGGEEEESTDAAASNNLDESVQVLEPEDEDDADSGAEDEADDEEAEDYGDYEEYDEEDEDDDDEEPSNEPNEAAGDASDSDSDIICLD